MHGLLVIGLIGAHAQDPATLKLGACTVQEVMVQGMNTLNVSCPLATPGGGSGGSSGGAGNTELWAAVNELVAENLALKRRLSALENSVALPPSAPLPPTPPVPPSQPLPPSFPGEVRTCPHEAGWNYLYELEDDPTVDDAPDAASTIATGFSTTNAYYVGNAVLDQIPDSAIVEVCAGTGGRGSTCSLDCHELNKGVIGNYITNGGGPSGLTSNFKRMVACFTGQCAYNGYTSGFFWYCPAASASICGSSVWQWSIQYATGSWAVGGSPAYSNGVGGHVMNSYHGVVHVWGSGYTLNKVHLQEVGFMPPDAGCINNGCSVSPSVWQLRWK